MKFDEDFNLYIVISQGADESLSGEILMTYDLKDLYVLSFRSYASINIFMSVDDFA